MSKIRKYFLLAYINLVDFLCQIKVGRIYPARYFHNYLVKHVFKFPFAAVKKNVFFVHNKDKVISSRIRWSHSYEDFDTDFLRTKINPGDFVLDVGANIGFYTVLFSEWVGKKGKVFAFEPDPDNFELLKKNINANGCRNVIAIQKAVSDKSGKTKLFLSDENKGDHRIWDSEHKREQVEIETTTLDEYLLTHSSKIDFIKIDVQGAEDKVFRGAKTLFQKNEQLEGFFEFWPRGLIECGSDPSEVLKTLYDYGLVLYEVEKKIGIKPVQKKELLQKYPPENLGEKENFTNIFFTKNIHTSFKGRSKRL